MQQNPGWPRELGPTQAERGLKRRKIHVHHRQDRRRSRVDPVSALGLCPHAGGGQQDSLRLNGGLHIPVKSRSTGKLLGHGSVPSRTDTMRCSPRDLLCVHLLVHVCSSRPPRHHTRLWGLNLMLLSAREQAAGVQVAWQTHKQGLGQAAPGPGLPRGSQICQGS